MRDPGDKQTDLKVLKEEVDNESKGLVGWRSGMEDDQVGVNQKL